MTWIKAPRDDYTVRNLERLNASSSTIGRARNTQGVENKDIFQRENVPIKRQAVQNRRRKDRRQQDRRQNQVSVLLNTRSNQDRRQSERRGDRKGMRCIKTGVDKYC